MSDMAYDNNAVHLTIDAYMSKNIDKENDNEIVEMATGLIDDGFVEDKKSNDDDDVSFFNLRKKSYRNWLNVPHTPYRSVSFFHLKYEIQYST